MDLRRESVSRDESQAPDHLRVSLNQRVVQTWAVEHRHSKIAEHEIVLVLGDAIERLLPVEHSLRLQASLVEDLAAIDMQARRLSPQRLRQLVGIGGRAARFIDRTFGKGDRE